MKPESGLNSAQLLPALIEGDWPEELSGCYVRNGSLSQFKGTNHSIFDGDGFLQLIQIKKGQASYSSHLIQTEGLMREREQNKSLFESVHLSRPSKNTSNTSIIAFGNKILSLWEWGMPYEIGLNPLRTVKQYDFDGQLRHGFTAHPKICAISGDLHFLSHHLNTNSELFFGQSSLELKVNYSHEVQLEHASASVHDFALTREHIVFFDHPLVYEGESVAWHADRNSKIHILDRQNPKKRFYIEIAGCWTFHIVSCERQNSQLNLKACRWPKYPNPLDKPLLYEWIIDLNLQKVAERKISDIDAEMPTTGLSLTGATCRYVYTCPSSLIESKPVNRFNKTDLISGESTEFIYGAEEVSGEPFFVAKSNESGLAGDKGWVLNLVTSHVRQQSYLYLHKADSNCLEVVACIRIPHFIPPGFHGQWISS